MKNGLSKMLQFHSAGKSFMQATQQQARKNRSDMFSLKGYWLMLAPHMKQSSKSCWATWLLMQCVRKMTSQQRVLVSALKGRLCQELIVSGVLFYKLCHIDQSWLTSVGQQLLKIYQFFRCICTQRVLNCSVYVYITA